ncbi:MAG: apolipoprotein N-acyltransferase, partial [Marinovum sp.]|nr:apolipoprotein N-acyltransferase [Marinovum sp.]
ETSLPIAYNFAEDLILQIKEASKGVPVLVGALRAKDDKIFNSLILIDPKKDTKIIYDKYHLVPFGEYLPFENVLAKIGLGFSSELFGTGFQHGPGPRVVNLPNVGKILPLICYEAVFPQDVSAMPQRADVIVQVTNDAWLGQFSGPYQHLAQAQMRSIEQGLPMVRVANTGVSGLIDPNGRIVEKLQLGETGYIDVVLPVGEFSTLYSRYGNWTVVILFMALGIGNIILRNRH